MATLIEIHERSGVALKTLERLDKLGFLRTTKDSDPIGHAIRVTLKKRRKLTTLMLVYLARTPELVAELGLQAQMDALGPISREAAPWSIGSMIPNAAVHNPSSVDDIAQWVRDFLDSQRPGFVCDHAYLGVRLLDSAPGSVLVAVADKLRACMWSVRPTLGEDYSTLDKQGRVIYRKPKTALAQFDL